jgi:hypothetical protein
MQRGARLSVPVTEQQGERILEKGTGPEGEEIRPPMHIDHMNHCDAKAITVTLSRCRGLSLLTNRQNL